MQLAVINTEFIYTEEQVHSKKFLDLAERINVLCRYSTWEETSSSHDTWWVSILPIYVAALDDESDEYNITITLLSQERNKKHFASWNLFVIVHIWNGDSRRGH